MAFRPGTRKYWIEVGGGKCQNEIYEEGSGFKTCGKPAKQVHHIIPESRLLHEGEDPNTTIGLPLCENCHVRNHGDLPFDRVSSFHPDMARAYEDYKHWKRQEKHMAAIMKRSINYKTSPFAETARGHREMAKRGERITTGDDFTDYYYTQKMRNLATEYNMKNGIVKPQYKEHPETDRTKKRRWYKGLFK